MLPGGSLTQALTQIAGENNANLAPSAIQVGRSFGDALRTRLGQVRTGLGSVAELASRNMASLSFGRSGGVTSGSAGMADARAGAAPAAASAPPRASVAWGDIDFVGPLPSPNSPAGWAQGTGLAAGDAARTEGNSVWVRGFGQYTTNIGDGNNAGFSRTLGGGMTGADTEVLPDLRLGAALGYAHAIESGRNDTGAFTSDSYHAGTYAGWTPGPWFVDINAGVTYTDFETRRSVAFGTLARNVSGKTSAIQGGAGVEAGYRGVIDGLVVEPSLDVRYDAVALNGFSESGGGILNLSVDGAVHQAFRTGLGAKISRTFNTHAGASFEPEFRARWEHDFLTQGFSTRQSLNGNPFTIAAAAPGRDAAVLGTGVSAVLGDNLKLYANYDAQIRTNQVDHQLTAVVRYTW